jgi:AraC-like DNA-binding protein
VRVENDAEPVESIAAAVGFSDPEGMRRAFIRLYGDPPPRFAKKGTSVSDPLQGCVPAVLIIKPSLIRCITLRND